MSANLETAAPKGRKKIAQGKEQGGSGVPPLNQGKEQRRDASATLGHDSQNTSSPEGAKERRALPTGWRWAQMSEVCTRVQDGTHFSPKEQTRAGDFKYITAKNIKHWGLDLSDLTYVPERIHREIYKRCNVEKGDVLYIKDGVTTGIATVNTLDEEFSLLSSVALLKPQREILDSLFLKYYLNSPEGFRNMTGQMTGTAIKRLILQKIKAAVVPVAPLPEQRRIVAEIEKQFTRLEAGVAALRRVQANLKRYRAAVLKAACEGRLVSTEAELQKSEGQGKKSKTKFESGEDLLARILTERRQNWQGRGPYKEPAAPNIANLPPIPEGWTWAALEAVSEAVGGFAFSSTKFVDAGYQVVKMANIRMGRIDLTQRPSFISDVTSDIVEKYSLREGDLVVTLTGTRKKRDYGYVAVVKNQDGLLLNQRIARVRPFAGMDSKFLQLAMQAEHYRDRFFSHETGNVGQGNVGMAAVTREMITLPPLAEQTRIVAEVERRLSVVEELESVVSANLQRAVRLRQSILQKAFTGQL